MRPPLTRLLSAFVLYSAALSCTRPELQCLILLPLTTLQHVRFYVMYSAPHHLLFYNELFRCSYGEISSRCEAFTRPSIRQLRVVLCPVMDGFLIMDHLHIFRPRLDGLKRTFRHASMYISTPLPPSESRVASRVSPHRCNINLSCSDMYIGGSLKPQSSGANSGCDSKDFKRLSTSFLPSFHPQGKRRRPPPTN